MADNHSISHKNLSEWIRKQTEEILGEDNRNYTRMNLGREPTEDELAWNYINNGGADDFFRRNGE